MIIYLFSKFLKPWNYVILKGMLPCHTQMAREHGPFHFYVHIATVVTLEKIMVPESLTQMALLVKYQFPQIPISTFLTCGLLPLWLPFHHLKKHQLKDCLNPSCIPSVLLILMSPIATGERRDLLAVLSKTHLKQ